MARALVIGGTGPTGPFTVEGLHERGYEVTILHTGQHEVEFKVSPVRHIHEDPHFRESLERGLGSEEFDLVVAQYGRLRVIAEVLAGRTQRLVAIGGATALYAGEGDDRWGRAGRPDLFPEETPLLRRDEGEGGLDKLAYRMVQAMEALFEHHPNGTYVAFPLSYGPRNPGPYDWSVIRRALDRRPLIVIADGGLKLDSRIHSENAAAAIMAAIDDPVAAAGERFMVTDEYTFSMRGRIEAIARHLGHEFELVDMPYEMAWPCHPFWRHVRGHRLTQSTLIRERLGFRDPVPADLALERTVDWLVKNGPEPGSDLERQVGDPFDYAAEDELVRRWREHRAEMEAVRHELPDPGHQYRHPKKEGEGWRESSAAAPAEQGDNREQVEQ